ncbi:M20 family metallopeptidase [Stieleria sp. TO1_6]|uniref:M20 family metallopeptidase n=1 Tax=Stieleria tagensis TaxID=2956795 RepID=UPI00209BA512|nr:M20 family metallopeptidase [Stieleria tagensis]MCO8121833.1 M20 family metallopeptidase [Stieleria tagensis]
MSNTMDDHCPDGTLESAIAVLKDLIAYPSVSSSSNLEISEHCSALLSELGFSIWRSQYDDQRGVRKVNLVAVRQPLAERSQPQLPGLAYFCHTDVVPAKQWIGPGGQADRGDPFDALVYNDRIYGRGACDMKGSFAAMVSAVARIDRRAQTAPIWLVCTADEEIGFEGAKHMVRQCPGYRQLVASDPPSIIGEPTEMNVVYAHKGIQGCKIRSIGRAGHSATAYGINANEAMVPMLSKLLQLCKLTREDPGLRDDRFDPPTLSWNFGFNDHSHVVNITPERSDAWVCLRTMPGVDEQPLFAQVQQAADQLGLQFTLVPGCDPLWTDPSSAFVQQLKTLAGTQTQTVCYATDGGVMNELSQRVVIGPGSIHQAHTVDEWIAIDQLQRGIEVYETALRHWCLSG